jgi:hypothetical protein
MTTHVMTDDRPDGRHAATAAAQRNGMPGGLPTDANHVVHASVLDRCVQRLNVKYGEELGSDLIRSTAHAAYRELAASARVQTFLPVTAAHVAENRLRALARASRTGRADATIRIRPTTAAPSPMDGSGAPERAAA